MLQKMIDVIPAGRAATVAEVASLVAYVASDEAGFITGQVLSINGGSSML
jgi:2,3-dihydroxy-2,3-dihydro-p-cumate dehydrogenase